MLSFILPPSRILAATTVGTVTKLVILFIFFLLTLYIVLSYWSSPSPQLDLSGEKHHYIPSSYDWANFEHFHPRHRSDMATLPDGPLKEFQRLQFDFENYPRPDRLSDKVLKERRDVVKDVFVRSWRNYKEKAWGEDELLPVSGGSKTTFYRWSATLVDSLDSLWIMDLLRDFDDGVAFVAQLNLMGPEADEINVFEVTIRFLGGLLAAYDLSGERVLLERARELGDLLYVGFDTPNRLPIGFIKFDEARAGKLVAYTRHSSAALGTLSMEFTRLSQLTGDNKYYDAIDIITNFLWRLQQAGTEIPGMWPAFIDSQNERIEYDRYTLGASADSLYEYLLKTHMLLGGRKSEYKEMFLASLEAAKGSLLAKPMLPDGSPDILFVGQWRSRAVDDTHFTPTQAHLGCFAGGMYGMAGKLFNISDFFDIGAKISNGCAWAYNVTGTGIMPELFHYLPCESVDAPCPWDQNRWESKVYDSSLPLGMARVEDTMYKLRPEALESLFLMYRMTGDPRYQELAWDMFQSIIHATETEFGYASIKDVMTTGPTTKEDTLEVSKPSHTVLVHN